MPKPIGELLRTHLPIPASGDAPGAIAVLAHETGQPEYARYGFANLEHRTPIVPATVFDTGSIAKSVTALLAALVLRQGGLSLDTPIRELFPELSCTFDDVCFGDLMRHRSGIRDYQQLVTVRGARSYDFYSSADILEMLCQQRAPRHDFLRGFRYSNSGYFLLAEAVSRLNQRPFAEVARETVFVPLRMTWSSFRSDLSAVVPNRAHSYGRKSDGGWRLLWTPTEVVGDAGLLSTAEDLVRWSRSWHDGSWDNALLRELHATGDTPSDQAGSYVGGLFTRTINGQVVYSHGGSFDGFRTELLYDPKRRSTLVLLANWSGAPTTGAIEALYHELVLSVSAPPGGRGSTDCGSIAMPPTRPVALRNPETGMVWQLCFLENSWVLSSAIADVPLRPISAGTFHGTAGAESVRLSVATDHSQATLSVADTSAKLDVLSDGAIPMEQMQQFAGRYRCRELAGDVLVGCLDGQLIMLRGHARDVLEWVGGWAFRSGSLWICFEANDRKISGFRLDVPRATGLYYEKVAAVAA